MPRNYKKEYENYHSSEEAPTQGPIFRIDENWNFE